MSRSWEGFEKSVTFTAAFDRRDPEPSKNYGIHGVDMRMNLVGPNGAVTFVVYTGWHLPHVRPQVTIRSGHFDHIREPMPAMIAFHSPRQLYEWDGEPNECDLLPDGQCWGDASYTSADDVFEVLVASGSEGVWNDLRDRYDRFFARTPTAVPTNNED